MTAGTSTAAPASGRALMVRLLPLMLATFAVGTDSFVIAGLLPAISRELGVSLSAAGQLVTVFAITFAVSASVLGALTSQLNRRRTLLIGLGVFAVGNVATAIGPTYQLVLAARILTAAGAGLINSAASASAAAIAPPEQRGRALGMVIGGLGVATAVGLPLGTLLGAANWRLTLWAVAGLGLVAMATIAWTLPAISLGATSLRDRLRPLGSPWVLGVVATTSLGVGGGVYLLYTYVAGVLTPVTGGSPAVLTVLLFVWGAGIATGTLSAGWLTDRFPPARVLLAALGGLVVVLAVTPWVVTNAVTATVWLLLWGFLGGIPIVPQQHRLVAHAPESAPVLLGLNSSANSVGIALGGAVGGIALTRLAPAELALPAVVITVLAIALTVLTAFSRSRAS